MKMHYLPCLFVGALWLLLNHTTYTVAQRRRVTLQDLPDCAIPCAERTAVDVGCNTKDTSCLCSHQDFSTTTLQCAGDSCRVDSLNLTNELLKEMCEDVSTTSSSTTTTSSSSTSTVQSKTTTTASSSTTSTSSTSQSSSTSTTAVVAPSIPSSSSSPTVTQSASSTIVLVQTVVVDQPSTTASAAGRLDFESISMVTRALAVLMFGLPLFILGVAVV